MDEYDEARQLILAAMRMRQKYMELSKQEFYKTTAVMLDGELPPSSFFCSQEKGTEGVMYTSAGDVITGGCQLVVTCSYTAIANYARSC